MASEATGLQLLIFEDDSTTVWPLPMRGQVVLGRGYDCDVRIDHATVSRRHAELVLPETPGELPRLRDLGSRNGCRAASVLLDSGSEVELRAGLFFEVGRVRCVLQRRVEGGSARPVTLALLESTDTLGRGDDAELLADAIFNAELRDAPRSLVVGPDAAWFRAQGNAPIHLLRHRTMRLLLDRLVTMRLETPGRALSVDTAFSVGWPGERALARAKQNRVYVMMHRLRKLGIGAALVGRDDGYLLDVAFTVDRRTT